MKPGYKIENRIPEKWLHYSILVYNWKFLNVVQNAPIIKNSLLLRDKTGKEKLGVWKLKNLKK
jgi:hypothetical protein